MSTPGKTLQIELEDVGGTSWWAGVLTTLASQTGSMTLRFVGRVDGERRYTGDTFSSTRTVVPTAPEEAFAPGMTESLTKLRREIEADGWVETGRGAEPYAFTFASPDEKATAP